MRSSERLRRLKAVLRAGLEKFGVFQTHLILNVLYVLVGAPLTAVSKLLGRDPHRPDAHDGSFWQDRDEKARTLDEFTRRY